MATTFQRLTERCESGLLLSGGCLVDGTGRPGCTADIRVVGDRIAEIGRDLAPGSSRTLNVEGLVISPGFIDLHAHSEGPLWRDPRHIPKVAQGVTLELLGQDGLGYAPVDSHATLVAAARRLGPWHGPVAESELTWASLGELMCELEYRQLGINVAFLVPHGTVRLAVMGDQPRPPSPDEQTAMKAMVRAALADGAFGISTGLSYAPASFASTDELVSLCQTMSPDHLFVPHLRSYGLGAFDSYQEGLEVAARANVPLHLTHALLNGESNKGRAAELLDLADGAATRTSFDVYPYDAGSTYLHVFLPQWLTKCHLGDQLRMLGERAVRDRLRSDLSHLSWDRVVLAGSERPALQRLAGSSIAEIASKRNLPPLETYCDILVEDQMSTSCVHFNGNLENIEHLMTSPLAAIASDSILTGQSPHPRGWGTFARFIRQYALETSHLTLEEALRRITSLPATILGIGDRGVLKPGNIADICCFDPVTVKDNATFANPQRLATGFRHVLVRGEPVILDGQPTDARPGVVVRHPRFP